MSAKSEYAIRKHYCEMGINNMKDIEILELILTYTKNEQEAKQLAETLIKQFGSLRRVFALRARDLARLSYIDESTAALIALFRNTAEAIYRNKNKGVWRLANTDAAKRYAENVLKCKPNECFLVITLTKDMKIISHEIISEGIYNRSYVDPKRVIDLLVFDSAQKVIIAHNHPQALSNPSQNDIELTNRLQRMVNIIGVTLVDHIIVGAEKVLSLKDDTDYVKFTELE